MVPAFPVVLGAVTPIPGVGVSELTGYWPALFRAVWFLAGFLVVFVVGWVVLDPLVSRVVRQRNRNNPTIDEAISRYFRLLVVVVAIVTGTVIAGYGRIIGDSTLVIAAATLAIGVAGQTVIGSLVSGVALVVDPKFNVGDYIAWDGNEGTVQSITLRVTRVLTQDGDLITVPNERLTAQPVTRSFGRGQYRIVDRIAVSYDADVTEAMAHLEAAAGEVEDITDAPSPRVFVDDFGSDAVVLRVHYWTVDPKRSDIFAVRSAYARAVKARLDGAGITISPPSKRDLEGRIEVSDAA